MLLLLTRKIKRVFPAILKKRLPAKFNVIRINEKESQRLNSFYHKKNKPTNVLSFRYSNDYGEILLCPQIIRREAKAAGNPHKYQMTWYILHGMIHLAGMHHETSARVAERIAKLEASILSRLFSKKAF